MKKKCAVVIPVYKQNLNVYEELSLCKARSILKKYDLIFVKPETLEWRCNDNEIIIEVDDKCLSSRRAYSNMVINKSFYELFTDYEYILIYQLDALVFKDMLSIFCDMNYDYIGAPWCGGHEFHNENGDIWYVGNGGFSLRKVDSFIQWLSDISDNQKFLATCMMEDLFIAAYGNEYLRMPTVDIALEFAFEINPDRSYKTLNGKLPFGCHGWQRFGKEFWIDLFEKTEYCNDFADVLIRTGNQEDEEARFLGDMDIRQNIMKEKLNYVALKACVKECFKNWDIENGVSIYGAGQYGLSTLNLLTKANIKVSAVLDTSDEKIGKFLNEVPIKSLEEYVDDLETPIIVAAYKTEGMENGLRSLGLHEKKDYVSIYTIQRLMIDSVLKKIVIYGAQAIALGTYNAIKELHPEINIPCFLVTAMGNNAPTLGGIPVRELNNFIEGMSQEEKDNIEVLIGTPESVMDAIAKSLDKAGLHNYVKLDSMRWAKLQEMAFIKSGKYVSLASYPDGVHIPDIKIFKMVHHKDKDLRTKYDDPQHITRLQVGATFADRTVADLQDNLQDNISDRNGNYSELTGLYWLWKNYILAGKADNGYVGLAHYRRFLEFSDDDLKKIQDNDIDAILPYPMPYEPNIEAHHLRYLSDSEWNAVLQALEELQPEYAEAFKGILAQEYFYNYNVILAKKEVLNDYCHWLFPLLFRIEEINDPNKEKEPNRYIGYIGETLETLYFMYNKNELKVAHAGCRFLI